jgi:hypothetical protein
MFVSDIGGDANKRLGPMEQGLASRIVFTEIDHQYVNPTTNRHLLKVGMTFRDVKKWNGQSGYRNPLSTFNEYMTWAVFTLYAHDTYETDAFEEIVKRTENLMVARRRFTRFRQFNSVLLKMYEHEGSDVQIADLYPEILEWAARQR